MPRNYNFSVYIGHEPKRFRLVYRVTKSLSRRTWKHREGIGAKFPARYQCKKLIYYEHYRDIRDAIARESPLKESRAKKVVLINRMNPSWLDLGADVLQDT